ncbi:MAG: hypothetical protein ACK55I_45330, partial [bacterium]
ITALGFLDFHLKRWCRYLSRKVGTYFPVPYLLNFRHGAESDIIIKKLISKDCVIYVLLYIFI